MIIIHMAASIVGGAITVFVVGQLGLLLALLAAPFGGSLFALTSAVYAWHSSLPREQGSVPAEVVWC